MDIADIIIEKRRLARPIRKVYGTADINQLMEVIKQIGNKIIKGFTIDSENEFAYKGVLKWLFGLPFECIDPDTNKLVEGNHYKGIYIAGNTGSGKSILLTIMAAIAHHYGIIYEFDGENIPLTWADTRSDELCNEFIMQGAEIVHKAQNANVLCLNDFGSEMPEQMFMGNRMNIIRQIVESRADKMGQFTLFSSNLPINDESIESKYGTRVASRLRQMCNYFILAGTDRRK